MHTLMETEFGAHLYGTDTPASDRDWRSVHLPPSRDILLQRSKPNVSARSKSDNNAKNTVNDVDRESWALHQFFKLLAEGQTVALDVLFSTSLTWTLEPHPVWYEIISNRSRFLSRKSGEFVRYCQGQASKYGIKGSRMAAARLATETFAKLMSTHSTYTKLKDIATELECTLGGVEHIEWIDKQAQPFGPFIRHLSVCQKMTPYTSSVKVAHDIYAHLFQEYGLRARQAESNQGIDWKAMSHAVRVGHEAMELLTTGHITFPRPERQHLIAIKTGQLTYREVADEIEMLLEQVEAVTSVSLLPAEPDCDLMDEIVVRAYRQSIATM